MSTLYIELILLFTFYCFLGWILETLFKSMQNKQFINSGFLFGPFCPIYGFGALLIIYSRIIIESNFVLRPLYKLLFNLFICIILTSCLEYLTAILLERLFKRRWWEYDDNFLNIKGRICMKYSLIWGAVSFFIVDYIHSVYLRIFYIIPEKLKYILALSAIFYFALDILVTVKNISNFRISDLKRKIFNIDEYKLCVNELIFHQSVQAMKRYPHHSSITCYKHCIHVSFYSYLLCKIFLLDYKSAARGALLHDLFLYDWKNTKRDEGMHGFVHPKIALNNASSYFNLNNIEKDTIIKHMFPLTIYPPKFKESIVVCIVDKLCASVEIFGLCSNKLMSKYLSEFF